MIDYIKGVIRFEGPLSSESVIGLMNELESKLKEFKEVIIYFTCNGGSISDSRILIDYLNRYCKRIELVCTWTLASCGFDVVLFFKGKKSVVSPVYGMVHLGTNSFDYLDGLDKKSFTTFNYEGLKRENTVYLKQLKPVLKKDEYDRVKKGEDVYLNVTRLREIFRK
jgi:hypothetical protein